MCRDPFPDPDSLRATHDFRLILGGGRGNVDFEVRGGGTLVHAQHGLPRVSGWSD